MITRVATLSVSCLPKTASLHLLRSPSECLNKSRSALLEYIHRNHILTRQKESRSLGHEQITDLVSIAKVRLAFVQRKWENVGLAMDSLGSAVHRSEDSPAHWSSWQIYLKSQYLHLLALWEGRQGNDDAVKAILKQLYGFVDHASEAGAFDELRRQGGVTTVSGPYF